MAMNLLEIALKLMLAIGLGGLIGLEREISQKPAGLRTNILICVGSTMMMILSQLTLSVSSSPTESLRVAAAVITGIGFIGAGTIIQSQGMVHGLTTASTIWAVSGLGLVIGAGYHTVALIYTLIVLITLITFRQLESKLLKKSVLHFQLKIKESRDILGQLKKLALHQGVKLTDLTLKKEGEFSLVTFALSGPEEKELQFQNSLNDLGDILEIKVD
ncbi:MAG: MgtC/SapB family protein [Candidatus Aminicenantes bacterium]|nr:MgtC/SapB family protein [Candidatus Aminicenantes bacterium]